MPASKKTRREVKVTVQDFPVRLSPAENALIAQLEQVGARPEADRLRGAGLPTRKVESYHYTDLKVLLRDIPGLATAQPAEDAPELRIAGAYRIMIANGQIQPVTTAPAGVIVGKAKGGTLDKQDDVIVRLNSALAGETLTINLDGSVDPVIHIDHRLSGEAAHCNDAVKLFVADGGSATVVETFSGSEAAHLGNHGSHVTLGKGAKLTHILVDLSGPLARHFASSEYVLNAEANLRSLVLHTGTVLARTQLFARFAGEGAHADFGGLNLVDEGQHADITLELEHAVPHTTSTEEFRSVARGRSKAVVQGKIVVSRDAQKTDSQMMIKGLMLSEQADIYAKPELEIFADDVVCGHGSTCGALEEQALFYLMSRGIPREQAEAMLVHAFIEDVLDPIEDQELHVALSGVTDEWLYEPLARKAS